MSSAGKSFGTQSPPLDLGGQNSPMGVSNIKGDRAEAVPDSQQRQQYFDQGNIASGESNKDVAETEKSKQD